MFVIENMLVHHQTRDLYSPYSQPWVFGLRALQQLAALYRNLTILTTQLPALLDALFEPLGRITYGCEDANASHAIKREVLGNTCGFGRMISLFSLDSKHDERPDE